ncbi:unnamed protein product [Camellia sinensis]
MFLKAYLLLFLLMRVAASDNNNGYGFTFNGNFKLGVGETDVTPDSLVNVCNTTAFYSSPLGFKNPSTGKALSFSTTFVFSILPEKNPYNYQSHGISFLIAPSNNIPGSSTPPAHIIAVELYMFNSVGVDVVNINRSTPAGYFENENGEFKKLTIASGEPIQAWVDYDGVRKKLNVSLAPINTNQPNLPLLSIDIDISSIVSDQMYVGFYSTSQSSNILGWSFQPSGKAQLDLSNLDYFSKGKHTKKKKIIVISTVSAVAVVSVLLIFLVIFLWVKRKAKFSEILEDWEVQYRAHRFSYKDLFKATKGFRENELLGRGGFGQVYGGVLPNSNTQVAVKRISQKSKQGMREFVAEIATIGSLRHPNLVRLLGYCRRKGELFLVYDFMPNASLDKFLFCKSEKDTLNWSQRFKIIGDVASGLTYLHEEWVAVVVHRDIKASNVLLDGKLNGKLGDFGLARCYKHHGNGPQTTNIAGTLGYIAPELARYGKPTTGTDVFAFGAFCLEVACGRKPVERRAEPGEVILVDWVLECSKKGEILKAADPKLKNKFEAGEMELVLKLGLLCSHPVAEFRPKMSQVLKYLKGYDSLPEDSDTLWTQEHWVEINDSNMSLSHHLTSQLQDSVASLTITELFTSKGR